MKHQPLALAASVLASTLLVACGGSDGDDSSTPAPGPSSAFTKTAKWTFALPEAGQSLCFDFDTNTQVAGCQGDRWDLEISSGGRSAELWTNSGISGPGRGGAFGGPFDRSWSELKTWTNATIDPVDGAMPDAVFFKDSSTGVFSGDNMIQAAAFEYNLQNDYQLYPNHRVFLVTTNSNSESATGSAEAPVFALQITGYYGGPTGVTSGHVSLRWINRSQAGASVQERTVDASSETAWVHLNLERNTLTDAAGDWHIAFNRYNVKLNGGDSGTGQVAGFIGKTPAGFYDLQGAPIVSQFVNTSPADTLADLMSEELSAPQSARNWIKDQDGSALNAGYTGTYPNALDFGWYRYHPTAASAQAAGLPATAHLLAANPEGASLLRSGEGDSYARFHVTEIRYADPSDYNSAQTWTIEFDVQPR